MTIPLPLVAVFVVLLLALTVRRYAPSIRQWWVRRLGRAGECVCGREVRGRRRHVVVSAATDDAKLGIIGGGTGMSADFCRKHCPGGCLRGCVPSTR